MLPYGCLEEDMWHATECSSNFRNAKERWVLANYVLLDVFLIAYSIHVL